VATRSFTRGDCALANSNKQHGKARRDVVIAVAERVDEPPVDGLILDLGRKSTSSAVGVWMRSSSTCSRSPSRANGSLANIRRISTRSQSSSNHSSVTVRDTGLVSPGCRTARTGPSAGTRSSSM